MKTFHSAFLLLFLRVIGSQADNTIRLLSGTGNYPSETCGSITGFSYFNQSSNTIIPIVEGPLPEPIGNVVQAPEARIHLDTIKNSQINFIANFGQACNGSNRVKCVILKLGTSEEKKEVNAPHTLYGNSGLRNIYTRKPAKTGWQYLEAHAYTDDYCRKGEISSRIIKLNLVTRSIDTVTACKLAVVHVGTTATSVTSYDSDAVTKATCDYLKWYIQNDFVRLKSYNATNISCSSYAVKDIPPPLQLRYEITVTFQVAANVSPSANVELPQSSKLTYELSSVLIGTLSAQGRPTLLTYVRDTIGASNPYYATTAIALA
jgi:hypothetical protein